MEQLRTRLAIWTEKPDAPPDRLAAVTLSAAEGSAATPRERGAVSGDFRRWGDGWEMGVFVGWWMEFWLFSGICFRQLWTSRAPG